MSETETREFEALLDLLKRNRGFDFTGYKRSSLVRRVRKRMAAVGIADFNQYSDYLEVHPDEFRELFNTILINVTAFLRDAEAWQALDREVLSTFVDRPEDRAIRVWSAGCASGEETYTLIMLLAEKLGVERFKRQVKVYATDADEEALSHARHATYSAQDLEPLPPEWRTRYFEASPGGCTFRHDLRRCAIFGEHDLVQDAPISRLDLLVCRNTLIYFNSETQGGILARFHFALDEGGFLFLGRSEMLLTHTRLYTPVDLRARIFTKNPRMSVRDRLLTVAQATSAGESKEASEGLHENLRGASFDTAPVAQVVIDRSGAIILANEAARTAFRIHLRDLGKPFHDLEISYRPIELRSPIEKALATHNTVQIDDVEFETAGQTHYFDIQIAPLREAGREPLGASVSFIDVTRAHYLRFEQEKASHELETAYEELQATNEELETTNEELQSTVEEIETTNEELQSTNEELETMNEELQSTNEELETINEELRRRTNELNTVNDFLETILTSMRAAVAVTDPNLNVTLWNSKAEDLWGLRQNEVEGKQFLALDFGLPVDELAKTMRNCLEGRRHPNDTVIQAINRKGRPIACRVTCERLVSPQSELKGLILFMEEWDAARQP